jgi:hypothetical protein
VYLTANNWLMHGDEGFFYDLQAVLLDAAA